MLHGIRIEHMSRPRDYKNKARGTTSKVRLAVNSQDSRNRLQQSQLITEVYKESRLRIIETRKEDDGIVLRVCVSDEAEPSSTYASGFHVPPA